MPGPLTPTSSVSTSAPASEWGAVFRSILGTVVDTGARVAVAQLDSKQAATAAEQRAALTAEQQRTELARLSAANTATTAQTWQKVAIIGGAVVLGVGLLLIIRRKS